MSTLNQPRIRVPGALWVSLGWDKQIDRNQAKHCSNQRKAVYAEKVESGEYVDGRWIRQERMDRKMSQQTLAKELGVSQAAVVYWEKGRSRMPISAYYAASVVFAEYGLLDSHPSEA